MEFQFKTPKRYGKEKNLVRRPAFLKGVRHENDIKYRLSTQGAQEGHEKTSFTQLHLGVALWGPIDVVSFHDASTCATNVISFMLR